LVIFALAFGVLAFHSANGEGNSGPPDQVVNPPNWAGTWTGTSRYGGETYICPIKNRFYGAYSNAGFFIGETVTGEGNQRVLEGLWYEGGRGYRNNWQGSFKIKISADNNVFDGFWYRVSQEGNPENRWHETRLGAPYPTIPTNVQCLAPVHQYLTGSFYSDPGYGRDPIIYNICRDRWDQIYGSTSSPKSYLEGWSVDSGSGFQGYKYDSDGRSGAMILRSISDTEVRGFYWRGRLAVQNIETAEEIILTRTSYISNLKACESVGPGFQQRLKGPDGNSSALLSASFTILALVLFTLI